MSAGAHFHYALAAPDQVARAATATFTPPDAAWINGRLLFDLPDEDDPLLSGRIALICIEGRSAADSVRVEPYTKGY